MVSTRQKTKRLQSIKNEEGETPIIRAEQTLRQEETALVVKQEPVDLDSKSEDNKPDLVGNAKPPVKDEKEGIKAEGDGEGGGLDNQVEMQDKEEVADDPNFNRVIRDIMAEKYPDFVMDHAAMVAVRTVAEGKLIRFFEASQLSAGLRKAVTVTLSDMKLVRMFVGP